MQQITRLSPDVQAPRLFRTAPTFRRTPSFRSAPVGPLRICAAAGRRASDGLQQAEHEAQQAADDLNKGLDRVNQQAAAAEGRGVGGAAAEGQGLPHGAAEGQGMPGAAAQGQGTAGAAAEGQGPVGGDVQGEMLKPSPANNSRVRGLIIGAVVVALARGTKFLPARSAAATHLVAWGILLGSNFYTTFVLGIIMFKNLPRQVFGRLQSKLFPTFFGLNSAMALIALATLQFSGVGILRPQQITLGIALAGSVLQLVALEPHTTKIMMERYELENAKGQRDNERIATLKSSFSKWHGITSTVNLAVFVGALVHGWYLAASMLRLAI